MDRTIDFWAGTFGNEYTERNRVHWRQRMPFWESVINYCEPATVLEVGANAGWNLLAIQTLQPHIECFGVDVNQSAVNEARSQGLQVEHVDALGIRALHAPGSVDLVFTCGMLIHVAPHDLESVMRTIVDTSGRYVLAVEYEAEESTEVEYRGHAGKLWKRPFGRLYQALGCKLLVEVPKAEGFDECTAWLLEVSR